MSEAPNENAVVVRDLVKRFGDFVAVDRVSFEVRRGEVFGFLGPNGAGKSTTIRMLCGILLPTAGRGTVAGRDIFTQAEDIKSRIGYMSQKFSLYGNLTVEENIDFYSGIYRIPRAQKTERKTWVLDMGGLEEYRGARTDILPAGFQQRLALGCALLHEPEILFLDEPTSGVDPINRRKFWDLIYALSEQGVTVFVTTHYMDEAENCDRLGLIYRGELIACDSTAELKSTLMPEDVLEVRCDRPQEALPELEPVPGVMDVSLFGTRLHVVVEDARRGVETVERVLRDKGFAVERVAPIPPSLEDVFVSLIQERDRTAGPLAEVRR